MSARPLVWLLDAHYQIFRAYHALPDLRAPDGTPVGALRGFGATLIRFLRHHRPEYVAAAFDHALTSFRNALYPDYKRGRTEAPPELEPQFELCARLSRALGIPVFAAETFEADDVLATLVRRLAPQARIRVVTRDKDLGALVSEGVTLYDLAREEESGPAEIEARLGVPPAWVADWLALVGDPVDHVPGVRGIGPASATALLRHFGSAAAISLEPEAWEGLALRGARRLREALAAGRERLALSRELVRLRDDLPFAPTLAELRWPGADRAALEALLAPLGLGGLLARVPRFRD